MLLDSSLNSVQQGLRNIQFWLKPLANLITRHRLFVLLLGISGNALVNYIFHLKYQTASVQLNLEEYYLALLVSHLILTVNGKLLNTGHASEKRFGIKLDALYRSLSLFLSTTVLLNGLVIGITYVFYNNFYAVSDLLIINLCYVPMALLFSALNRKQPRGTTRAIHWIRWSWVSVVLLGIGANTLVNLIFDYKYQRTLISTSLEEYFNAMLAAYVLLNGTRWITRKLDLVRPWANGVIKRLSIQLLAHFGYLVFTLNALVIGITYVFYGGFYDFDELMVINMSMILLTVLFTGIDTSIHFYKHWKADQKGLSNIQKLNNEPIQISLGRSKHFIEQNEINCVRSRAGLTIIHTMDGRKLPYSKSMEKLMTQLNVDDFFRANRQTIIHRSTIRSFQSLAYGRLAVQINCNGKEEEPVNISRARAARFRKWLSAKADQR